MVGLFFSCYKQATILLIGSKTKKAQRLSEKDLGFLKKAQSFLKYPLGFSE